jgi:ubiquitin carboxyl-terminal hydrolase 7
MLSYLASASKKPAERFEDARDYYEFLHTKKTVKFCAHPSRSNAHHWPQFELVLSSKISYDTLAARVGEHIGVQPTHIRFWTVNNATGNPKTTVKRNVNSNLQLILNPSGYAQMNSTQRADAFYFEVLDISLAELDLKKSVKIIWLSEGISKEVRPYSN